MFKNVLCQLGWYETNVAAVEMRTKSETAVNELELKGCKIVCETNVSCN